MGLLGVLVAALICAVLWKRVRFSRKRKRGEISPRTRLTGVALGNALQVLEEIVHPHVRHVLQERLKEQENEDESGSPVDPAEHLLRQARRIQRGEPVECITTFWRCPDSEP